MKTQKHRDKLDSTKKEHGHKAGQLSKSISFDVAGF